MQEQKLISADSIDEMWGKVSADISSIEVLLEYSVLLDLPGTKILLEIDIDPGGGFESGYQTTNFSSQLHNSSGFKFAIHHEGFIDEIGKFFGMQDVITGYPQFDKKMIVKTNDQAKVKAVFSDEKVRNIFQDRIGFTFHTTAHHVSDTNIKGSFLELNIEEGITDPVILREIYSAFYSVLLTIDAK